jgi:DNA-binding transcriptional ArsR family regulator
LYQYLCHGGLLVSRARRSDTAQDPRVARKDRTAGEIAEQFPIAFASVSHHLGVLKAADLVATEREGQFIRYRLNTTVFQEVMRYFMTRFGGEGAKDA